MARKDPLRGLQVGHKVRLRGYPEIRTIVEIYNQERYKGGVRLDQPVPVDSIFVSWNADDLVPCRDLNRKTT